MFLKAYHKSDGMRNLARFKPTKLSSTLGKEFRSSMAVNGLSQSMYKRGGCAATKGHLNGNWWQVDLEAVYDVWEVVVTNAGHCCGMLDFLAN